MNARLQKRRNEIKEELHVEQRWIVHVLAEVAVHVYICRIQNHYTVKYLIDEYVFYCVTLIQWSE